MNVCIDSIRPLDSGHVIRNPGDGPVVVFITQQNSSDVIRNVTSAFPSDWRSKKPPTTCTYQRKPEDSYILILNDGHRCEIEGVPAVRYSNPRKHIEEAVEAGRAVQAYKDIYKIVSRHFFYSIFIGMYLVGVSRKVISPCQTHFIF